VTLWTSGADAGRAGLTVSSVLVADGEPAYVIGVIDALSDLADVLRSTEAAVVNILGWPHRQLADQFGYVAPAPGGPFRYAQWDSTEWGPALAGASAWAGCRLAAIPDELGWGLQVRMRIEHVEVGDDVAPLIHRRGRYFTVQA
jgi:flavin reductase (DIM6/NTAB) family NADH-FMN oxidoreductase RutF